MAICKIFIEYFTGIDLPWQIKFPPEVFQKVRPLPPCPKGQYQKYEGDKRRANPLVNSRGFFIY
jgi:hypothetical protein